MYIYIKEFQYNDIDTKIKNKMNKIRQEKYKAKKVDMNNKRRAKYHDIDMEVHVN